MFNVTFTSGVRSLPELDVTRECATRLHRVPVPIAHLNSITMNFEHVPLTLPVQYFNSSLLLPLSFNRTYFYLARVVGLRVRIIFICF